MFASLITGLPCSESGRFMVMRADFSGEQVGSYFVRERIGQGGMADVYRAYQSSVNREVALKLIPLMASAEHEVIQRRFQHEAETITSLEHPHILPVFDYGISGDVLYIATRYLRGGTLRDVLNGEPLPPEWIIGRLIHISSALDYAHRRGIIHRDLKPSNVLLDDDQNAYLADFGLAQVLGGSSQLTTTGSIIGTPAYMAPEQLRGDPIDHRADLYSLGVILYQMFTGSPPFEALTTFSLIYQQVEKEPPSPLEFNADLPENVVKLLMRALEKAPAMRFESAHEMANEFARVFGHDVEQRIHDWRIPTSVYRRQTLAMQSLDAIPVASVADTHQAASLLAQGTPHEELDPITTEIPYPRVRDRQAGVVLGILSLLVVAAMALLFMLRMTNSGVPSFTLLHGVEGLAEETVPSGDEVAIARRALGQDGFVAYITCNQTSEFFAVLARRMFDTAQEYGLDMRLYDPETSANQQIIEIERARREGAKALIVCVVAEDVVGETLAAAAEAGLPLVLHNIVQPPDFDAVIMTHDEYMLGYVPGEYAGEVAAQRQIDMPSVVVLDFPDLPSIVERANGLQDGFLTHVPDANIVGRYLGGTTSFARHSVEALLENNVDFDVVLSINDAGAYGAIEALEQANVNPDDVIIVGIDAEAQARDYIRDGHYMWATMQVANKQMPVVLLDSIVKQLGGGIIPQVVVLSPGELIPRSE